MREKLLAACSPLLVVLMAPACSGDEDQATPPRTTTETVVSTATMPTETGGGRPRQVAIVPDEASEPLFDLEPVAEDLASPVYVAAPASEAGRVYIVEREGRVLVLEGDRVRPEPFLDIRRLVRTAVEEGLHSIAFHPRYETNHRFFVDYNDRRGDIRVVEYRSDGSRADPSSARELLFIDKTQGVKWHNGGQLQFGPDGLLYVSMGDSARNFFDGLPNPPRTADPRNNAQNPDLLFGKLLRLDVDARRPKAEMVAYGLRNAWRFSFDRATGDVYIADVGQFEHEEVDFVPNGGFDEQLNFGWSVYEGLEPYNRRHRLASRSSLVWPVLTYEHATGAIYCPGRASIVGGYVYRGTSIPGLAGRYVFGDYCTGELWSLRIEDGRAVDVRKEPESVSSLSSFGEDANGELYATALVEGTVYKLVPAG